MKGKTVFLIVILLAMVYAVVQSLSFGHYEAMLAPLLVSSAIIVLGVVELAKELRAGAGAGDRAARASEKKTRGAGDRDLGRFAIAFGWMTGFAVGIYLLGFFIGTLLFAFAYLKLHGRPLLHSVLFSAGFTAMLYLVFNVGFRAQLYRGVLF